MIVNGEELLAAGFNVETVEYKNISFSVMDVGGQGRVRVWISQKCNLGRIYKNSLIYTACLEVLVSFVL